MRHTNKEPASDVSGVKDFFAHKRL